MFNNVVVMVVVGLEMIFFVFCGVIFFMCKYVKFDKVVYEVCLVFKRLEDIILLIVFFLFYFIVVIDEIFCMYFVVLG